MTQVEIIESLIENRVMKYVKTTPFHNKCFGVGPDYSVTTKHVYDIKTYRILGLKKKYNILFSWKTNFKTENKEEINIFMFHKGNFKPLKFESVYEKCSNKTKNRLMFYFDVFRNM